MSRPGLRPWIKVWRHRTGSFAQVSLLARGVFSEILTGCDDEGRFYVGKKAPWEAVAFALGATRSDRRNLKRLVDELLEVGSLRVDGEWMVAPGFRRHQDASTERELVSMAVPKADANEPRTDRGVTRTGRERDANEPHTDHIPTTYRPDTERKPAESLMVGCQSRVEKSREEETERRTDSPDHPVRSISALADPERVRALVRHCRRSFAEAYLEATGGHEWPGFGADYDLERLGVWAISQGIRLDANPERLADGAIRGLFATRQRRYWQLKILLEDPARYAESWAEMNSGKGAMAS